jgi:hypothetical protein
VSANQGFLGTPTGSCDRPIPSIVDGMNAARGDSSKTAVWVAAGMYAGIVSLIDGVSVYGAFSPNNLWVRDVTKHITTFTGGQSSGDSNNTYIGVSGNNILKPTILDGITVSTGSNFIDTNGVHCSACHALQISQCTITSGDVAGDGTGGSFGTLGQNGSDGAKGGNADDGRGNAPGAGGSGGTSYSPGGAGGRGGRDASGGQRGGSSSCGIPGGSGGAGSGGNGIDGSPGSTGVTGDPGLGGTNTITLDKFFPPSYGSGVTGGPGGGE